MWDDWLDFHVVVGQEFLLVELMDVKQQAAGLEIEMEHELIEKWGKLQDGWKVYGMVDESE